ncbi:MAG: tyrosine-type recombinase/integrase [Thermodesulfobacteriota bacterium]
MEKDLNFVASAKKEKEQAIKQIARIVRREGWDYENFLYAYRRVREHLNLKPSSKAKKLPRLLSEKDFKTFYQEIEKADNLQHELMLKLLFLTGVRNQELANIKVDDVYLDENKVFIESGKGRKDRYVLYNQGFKTTLKVYIKNYPKNKYLFQTRLNDQYTPRRIQQIVKYYAEKSGIKATPHTFRHQAITWLSKHGFTDAELMVITGHSSKESLKIYQHLDLKDVEKKYQKAMKKVEF